MQNRNEIWKKIVSICRDVFDDDTLFVSEDTVADDVEGWDSLTQLALISSLEEEFGISFTLAEVTKSKNLGELLDAVIRHLGE